MPLHPFVQQALQRIDSWAGGGVLHVSTAGTGPLSREVRVGGPEGRRVLHARAVPGVPSLDVVLLEATAEEAERIRSALPQERKVRFPYSRFQGILVGVRTEEDLAVLREAVMGRAQGVS